MFRRHRILLSFLVPLAACSLLAADPDERIVTAARAQDSRTVRALLDQKKDSNTRSSDGSTALLWSAHWNDSQTAELLLARGADPNLANDYGVTPLSEACLNRNGALVALLLTRGANPNLAIATSETPLMTCARTGSLDGVRELIGHDANVNAKESNQNQTALMWAAAERHTDVIKALIQAKADVNARSKQGFAAVHFSARVGDTPGIQAFLEAGVDINILTQTADREAARNAAGLTPLLVATLRAEIPAALYLLEHGADPNIEAAGMTPLHWAATTWEGFAANPVYGFNDPMSGIPDRAAKLQLVKALLSHGANVNARMTKRQPSFATGYTDALGATPFLLAASVDDVEMMRILLNAGADPKITTETKASAVMAATGLNHGIGESLVTEADAIAAVRLLLDLGLDPKGETTFGENALFGPAYRGWNTLLAQLIDLGVNVNAVSKAGVTPWLAASGQGDRLGGVLYNKAGAELLEKHGADPKLGTPCDAQNKCREK